MYDLAEAETHTQHLTALHFSGLVQAATVTSFFVIENAIIPDLAC